MSANEMVLQKLDSGLLTITMNRPERRNALNPDMTRGLVEAARRAAEDHEVRAVLLKGAGGTFCVGGDVKSMAEGRAPLPFEAKTANLRKGMEVSRILHQMPKPVVAQLDGAAAGAGCRLRSPATCASHLPPARSPPPLPRSASPATMAAPIFSPICSAVRRRASSIYCRRFCRHRKRLRLEWSPRSWAMPKSKRPRMSLRRRWRRGLRSRSAKSNGTSTMTSIYRWRPVSTARRSISPAWARTPNTRKRPKPLSKSARPCSRGGSQDSPDAELHAPAADLSGGAASRTAHLRHIRHHGAQCLL